MNESLATKLLMYFLMACTTLSVCSATENNSPASTKFVLQENIVTNETWLYLVTGSNFRLDPTVRDQAILDGSKRDDFVRTGLAYVAQEMLPPYSTLLKQIIIGAKESDIESAKTILHNTNSTYCGRFMAGLVESKFGNDMDCRRLIDKILDGIGNNSTSLEERFQRYCTIQMLRDADLQSKHLSRLITRAEIETLLNFYRHLPVEEKVETPPGTLGTVRVMLNDILSRLQSYEAPCVSPTKESP